MTNENNIQLDGNILDEEVNELSTLGLNEENTNDYDFAKFDEDEEYEVSTDEEDDEENEEDYKPAKSNKSAGIIVLLVVLLLIIALVAFVVTKLVSHPHDKSEAVSTNNIPAVEISENNSGLENSDFFSKNSDGTNTDKDGMLNVNFNDDGNVSVTGDGLTNENTVVSENNSTEENKNTSEENISDNSANMVKVSWDARSRQNPFKPPVFNTSNDEYEKYGNDQFEIIEPPTKSVPDSSLTMLLQTQISGILYDEESPSAIIHLAGKDQFVKVGDEISGYKIRKITRNKVEITYKNNTYVASVGELFTPGKLEKQPAVANLSNKFAGRYKNGNVEE